MTSPNSWLELCLGLEQIASIWYSVSLKSAWDVEYIKTHRKLDLGLLSYPIFSNVPK